MSSHPAPDPGASGAGPEVESILLAALARAGSAEWIDVEALVRAHPAHEAALRAGVADLRFLERLRGTIGDQEPSSPGGAAEPASSSGGSERYRFGDLLGSGGMGAVYRVFDARLRRTLAMKVAKPGRGEPGLGPSRLARFVEEAQVLAQLEHPAIVPVHELGQDELGRPWFTMKLVEGRTLDAVFALARKGDERWTLARVVAVLVRVCEALTYAHERGVLHRDLKPGNVMVGDLGEVYVVDWGLARVGTEAGPVAPAPTRRGRIVSSDRRDRASTDPGSPLRTADGDTLGTPEYMAPEQAAGEQARVGPRSDVYSLGAILYHLLSGRVPYHGEGEAPTLDQVLERIERGPPRALLEIAPRADPELAAVCARAMAREPERRYASARELAEDLRAWQEGFVVRAHAQGPWAELRKWVRRNRGVSAAIFAAATTSILAGGILWNSVVTERASSRARYATGISAASLAFEIGEPARGLELLRDLPAGMRGWEWSHLSLCADGATEVWQEPVSKDGAVVAQRRVVVADGLQRAFAADQQGRVRAWSLPAGEPLPLAIEHGSGLAALALSPDERWLATGGAAATVRLWDARTGEAGPDLAPAAAGTRSDVTSLAFDRGGAALVAGDRSGHLCSWSLADGFVLARRRAHEGQVLALASSPASDVIASGSDDGSILLWSSAELEPLARWANGPEPLDRVASLALSPDGRHLASGSFAGRLRVWDVATRELAREWTAATTALFALAFSRDGRSLATGSLDRDVRTWRFPYGGALSAFGGHADGIDALAFDAGGERLVSASRDGSVRSWRADTSGSSVLRGHDYLVEAVAFAPDGRTLASGGGDRSIRLWDPELASATGVLRGRLDRAECLAWSSDGATLVSGNSLGEVDVWDTVAGTSTLRLERPPPEEKGPRDVTGIALDPSASWVFAASQDGALLRARIADPRSSLEVLATSPSPLHALALSPRGDLVATGDEAGFVVLWSPSDGARVAEAKLHAGAVTALAFAPDGRTLATASRDRTGRVVSARDLAPRVELRGHGGELTSIAFHPDGTRLATGSYDGSVLVWRAEDGFRLLALAGHEGWVLGVAFDPRGERLASASADRTVRVWETALPEGLLERRDAERARERRVARAIEEESARGVWAADLAAALAARADLDADERETAVRLARAAGDDDVRLQGLADEVALRAGRTREEYELALRRARAAFELRASNEAARVLAGVLLVRLGEASAALDLLPLREADRAGRDALIAAVFRTLALRALGREGEAASAEARARSIAGEPRWAGNELRDRLLRELAPAGAR